MQLLLQIFFKIILYCIIGILGSCIFNLLMGIFLKEQAVIILQHLFIQNYHYLLTLDAKKLNTVNGLLAYSNRLITIISNNGLFFYEHGIFTLYVKVLLLSMDLWILKIYWLYHLLLLFGLLGILGFFDGFVQRSIRRVNVAHESSGIYHQAKSFIYIFLAISILLTLMLPLKAEILYRCLMVLSLLFSLSIQQAVKHYKKYL